jgi:ABC-2 type transport system permease protein
VINMRMQKSLLPLIGFQFRSLVRNKIAFFFSLVMPLALLVVFGAIYAPSETSTNVTVGLIDKDGGPVARALREAVDGAGTFTILTDEESVLRTQLEKGKIRVLMILPEGLSAQTASGPAPGMVTLLYDRSSSAAGPAVAGLQAIIGRLGMELSGSRVVLAPDAQPFVTEKSFTTFEYLLPGQLAFALLSAGLMTVGIALANQRQAGTLRHMFSTPLSIGLYTTSRLIANVLMALLQIGLLYGAAMVLFDVALPANLVGTLVLLVFGALATVGMGLAVGTLSKNAEQAFPMAMTLYMSMAFLGGAMMPIETAPAIVTTLSKFVPVTYMTHSLKLVMMQGQSLGVVWVDLLVLAGCAVGLTSLAMWRMRRQFALA